MIQEFSVGSVRIGDGNLTLIAGPCLAESSDLCFEVAGSLKELCSRLGLRLIFKASFDKANRTSGHSSRGLGIEEGLAILAQVKNTLGLPVTTDVHESWQAAKVAEVADLVQVPAFLCRQTDLLAACAATAKPVNVKKGQFLAPWDVGQIVQKLQSFRAKGVLLTERGTSFGYNNLVVDMAGLEVMRGFGWPVCFDATHSSQRPGGEGSASGGNREAIPALARAAVAVGIDALFLEVHPQPDRALSDAATQWPLSRLQELLEPLVVVHEALKSKAALIG